VASRRGRICFCTAIALVGVLPYGALDQREALAGAESPLEPSPPPAPTAMSREIEQSEMVHIFDTTPLAGGPHYVNDHTLIQATDRSWHLFGIFHREPIGEDSEFEFIHAVTNEADPSRWQ